MVHNVETFKQSIKKLQLLRCNFWMTTQIPGGWAFYWTLNAQTVSNMEHCWWSWPLLVSHVSTHTTQMCTTSPVNLRSLSQFVTCCVLKPHLPTLCRTITATQEQLLCPHPLTKSSSIPEAQQQPTPPLGGLGVGEIQGAGSGVEEMGSVHWGEISRPDPWGWPRGRWHLRVFTGTEGLYLGPVCP